MMRYLLELQLTLCSTNGGEVVDNRTTNGRSPHSLFIQPAKQPLTIVVLM